MGTAGLTLTSGTGPWRLPSQGLAVFEGDCDAARLSHYFLPSLVRARKRILFLDGANSVNPRLMAWLGQRRGIPFGEFNTRVRICRAFTCFQLTELIARVPKFLTEFPAEVVIVTAFPELYLDEDIRDWDARVAFERGLSHVCTLARQTQPRLAVAVFSSYETFIPSAPRRGFFTQTSAAASEVWKLEPGDEGKLRLLPVRIASHGEPIPTRVAAALALPVMTPSSR